MGRTGAGWAGRRTRWGAQDQTSLGGGRAVVRVPCSSELWEEVLWDQLGPGARVLVGQTAGCLEPPLLTQPLQAAPPSSRSRTKDRKVPLGSPAWRGSLCSGGPEVPAALRKKRRAPTSRRGSPRSRRGSLVFVPTGNRPPGRPRGWPQPETQPPCSSAEHVFRPISRIIFSWGQRTCWGRKDEVTCFAWSFSAPSSPFLDGILITVPPFWTNPHTHTQSHRDPLGI